MIKFFRKTRQNLISERKTGKYFKYALGEIVLVVIGILIALGINNWNTKRYKSQQEKEALSVILTELERNAKKLIRFRNKENLIVRDIDALFQEKRQIGTYSNDTLEVYLGKALEGSRFNFVTVGYDVLISGGIDLIKDSYLKYEIANYYGQDIPDAERVGNDLYKEWYDEILPIIRKEAKEWNWSEFLKPKSMDSIFQNRELFEILMTNKTNHIDAGKTLTQVLERNENLQNRIRKYIKK